MISFFFSVILLSQNTDSQKYLLTTSTTTFGITTLSLLDPYLSPLIYSGNGIDLNHESRKFLSLQNTNFSIQNKYCLVAGFALNPAQNSLMTYLGANCSWGMHYHLNPQKNLRLLVGGSWDVDFGYKDVLRNINNPVNIDLATNLNLSGIAKYDISLKKRTFRLQLAVETPIVGWMFVPLAGASYYEMFELGNLSDVSHFSSIINKRGINSKLTVDVPFKNITCRIGLGYKTLKYAANSMVFENNEFSLLIGTTFDRISFGGTKKIAPRNFISTNE